MTDHAKQADDRYANACRRVREHLYPVRCRLDYMSVLAMMGEDR